MRVIRVFIGLVVAALAMSFMGAVHPLGDSLAVFRIAFCLVLLVCVLALPRGGYAQTFLIGTALLGLGSALWHRIPVTEPGPVTIYQKNVLHWNAELSLLAADILSAKPDFVTLQEVSEQGEPLLHALKTAYPYQHLCRFSSLSGVAVLSRLEPIDDGYCRIEYGMALITVDLPSGPHHVAAVHLSWPFPRNQASQLKLLSSDLRKFEHPFLIGGDFNMVPWSHALTQVAKASGTRRSSPARTTFLIGSVPLAIDHVFAPGGGYVETRPLLGADHFGLVARVHPAPQTSVRINAN